jgi:hypothetical protein
LAGGEADVADAAARDEYFAQVADDVGAYDAR